MAQALEQDARVAVGEAHLGGIEQTVRVRATLDFLEGIRRRHAGSYWAFRV
jgi:hypothetical protein